jgi:hypothetical protein
MTEHSQETKIAILEAKVEHMMSHVKELTLRVRANEKVVASVSLLGVIACTFVGAGYFAPKAEAYPEYLEPRTQVIPGSLPNSAEMAQNMINKFREWEWEQQERDAEFDINNALAEYFNGSNGSTEQEELLQLPGNGDQQSIGWRYDRRDDRSGVRPFQEGESESGGS